MTGGGSFLSPLAFEALAAVCGIGGKGVDSVVDGGMGVAFEVEFGGSASVLMRLGSGSSEALIRAGLGRCVFRELLEKSVFEIWCYRLKLTQHLHLPNKVSQRQ